MAVIAGILLSIWKYQNHLNPINSRTCDCEFCKKHSASYISDPSGKLIFTINEQSKLNKYHQGSGIVDFLVCNNCGVLVGGCYEEYGILFSAVNIKAVASISIGNETIVSPKNMDDKDKIQRWKKLWFSKVELGMMQSIK